MTRFICVTGTDTEVGKTVVTEALALGLTQRGLSVVAIKPVESGTKGNEAGQASSEVAEDGVKLARATGQRAPTAALTRLRTPVAPPVAADLDLGPFRKKIDHRHADAVQAT